MIVDYQTIVDMIANIGIIVFPIAVILCIADKLVDTFLMFISGKRVKI